MQITEAQRQAASAAARLEEREASAYQDATKLIRGFEELDELAGRRGVWELTQNACDLTQQCEITVDFRNGELAFTHNGTPFTTQTLTHLIKQVSSKSPLAVAASEVESGPVGRFGTGFITTHAYGRRLWLSGSLEVTGLAAYVPLREFQLDRTASDAKALATQLAQQLGLLDELLQTAEYVATAAGQTTFRYRPASAAEQASVQQAWESLQVNTPYVMALNRSLQQVRLVDAQGRTQVYRKGEVQALDGYWQLTVTHDDQPLPLTCLYEPYGPVQVLAPLDGQARAAARGPAVPRLFLYFPLIGSEQWGSEFIVHAAGFAPRNERDGVHLTLTNDAVRELAYYNQQLLLAASERIFAFLTQHAVRLGSPLPLARVNFTAAGREDEQPFRQQLQRLWREQLAQLPLVEAAPATPGPATRLTPAAARFLHPALLQGEGENLAAVQRVAAQLWPGQLPLPELASDWATTLLEWQGEEVNWILPATLAAAIAARQQLAGFAADDLLQLYRYLKDQGHGDLFERYALLPNLHGDFRPRGILQQPQELAPVLLQVLAQAAPPVLTTLSDERFAALEPLPSFTRRLLAQQVNDEVLRRRAAAPADSLPASVRDGLLLLCSIFPPGAAAANGLRWRLLPLLHQFYGRDYAPVLLASVAEADEIRYDDQPLPHLVRQFLRDARAAYGQVPPAGRPAYLEQLRACLELLSDNREMCREVLGAAAVFPNQLGELVLAEGLELEKDFGPGGNPQLAEQLKDWAEQVTGQDCRRTLAHPDFATIVRRMGRPERDGRTLGSQLETNLIAQHPLDRINDHTRRHQAVILAIIQQMSQGWEPYFGRISGAKATITLNRVTSAQVKDSLFTIMTLPDEHIADLAELASAADGNRLLTLARTLLAQQRRQAESLAFKKLLGKGIEEVVQAALQGRLRELAVEVLDQQHGQDIVMKVAGNPVYRLEVKARWDPNYTTTMSYRQLSTALDYPRHYALCAVDLADYQPTDGSDRYHITALAAIQERIRFVPDIAAHIQPLLRELKRVEGREDEVRLADEFRVVIPRRITTAGLPFEQFIAEYLLPQLLTAPAPA